MPIDVADMATVLRRIEKAIAAATPFLMSTANLNFLVTSRYDSEFRESLLLSDLCTADGMPIVWLSRLLGIPIKERIAGSDIFERLKSTKITTHRLKVFLFGGGEGVATAACKRLNAGATEMTCVGSFYPGFGDVDEMSTDGIIDTINSSNADFLAVALGAQKGQMWLRRNHERLRVPVRVHLGATINFQAGTLKRAPISMQKWGLEWLWRIKEEPQLWKRYWNDGIAMLLLLLTRVMPIIVMSWWDQLRSAGDDSNLQITQTDSRESVIFNLNGVATEKNVSNALPYFEKAVADSKNVVINFTDTRQIDARFLGLILMLNKQLKKQGHRLGFTGVSSRMDRIFRLNGFGFLLSPVEQ
jgi:N-acetylglucosaminyldiphosphoundecaprenol N-acetyl-beta-D-mannosaminyltransferase